MAIIVGPARRRSKAPGKSRQAGTELGRRKAISKRGVSSSSERDQLLMLMTTPCRSSSCRFKGEDGYLCQLPPSKMSDYEGWCRDVLCGLADLNSKSPAQELVALRRFREDEIPLPCTVQAIRDFVYYDLTSSNQIADVQELRKAVKQSFDRLQTIYAKCSELGIKQVAELDRFTERAHSLSLWEQKDNLTRLIIRALETEEEIYEYELELLDRINGDTFSLAQALHLIFILPPEITSKCDRYWSEIAVLLNAATRVWRTKKLRGLPRAYTADALEKSLERFTTEERTKLRDALSLGISDLFPRVFNLDSDQVRQLIAEKTRFNPPPQAIEMMKIAEAVRHSQIKFGPDTSP